MEVQATDEEAELRPEDLEVLEHPSGGLVDRPGRRGDRQPTKLRDHVHRVLVLEQDHDRRPALLQPQATTPARDGVRSSMQDVARYPRLPGPSCALTWSVLRPKPNHMVLRLGEPGVVELRRDALEERDERRRGERTRVFGLDPSHRAEGRQEQADHLGGTVEPQLGVAHLAAPDLALTLDGTDRDGVELAHDVRPGECVRDASPADSGSPRPCRAGSARRSGRSRRGFGLRGSWPRTAGRARGRPRGPGSGTASAPRSRSRSANSRPDLIGRSRSRIRVRTAS